jgi:hypothetical protein
VPEGGKAKLHRQIKREATSFHKLDKNKKLRFQYGYNIILVGLFHMLSLRRYSFSFYWEKP